VSIARAVLLPASDHADDIPVLREAKRNTRSWFQPGGMGQEDLTWCCFASLPSWDLPIETP
jgi:hypothetical protein